MMELAASFSFWGSVVLLVLDVAFRDGFDFGSAENKKIAWLPVDYDRENLLEISFACWFVWILFFLLV